MGKSEAIDASQEDLEHIGEIMAENATGRQLDLFHKILSIPGQVDSVKKIIDALEKIVLLERKVYGIDTLPAEPPKYDKVEIELVESRNSFPEDGEEGR
jgi:hypothetical protein